MKGKITILFLTLALCSFSQTKAKKETQKGKNEGLMGVYQYKRQETKDGTSFAIIKITLNKDQTFSLHTSSQAMHESSDYTGTWNRSKDTLFLLHKDENVDKYLISGKTICDLSEPNGQACLEKIK